jgi:hypothetical protein
MATTDKDVNGHQEKVESGIQPHGEHLEGEPDPKEAVEVILKSSLDDLSLWTTVKRFRKVGYYGASLAPTKLLTWRIKAVIICNLLCIAAAADGFQYTLNGQSISSSCWCLYR